LEKLLLMGINVLFVVKRSHIKMMVELENWDKANLEEINIDLLLLEFERVE